MIALIRSLTSVKESLTLSLAIGKDGQNVRLASKLSGFKIDIVNESGKIMTEIEKSQVDDENSEVAESETKEEKPAEESTTSENE